MAKKKKNPPLEFRNKKAFFDFNILDKLEAGMVLFGSEVKSIREGKVNLTGTYCIFHDNELFIKDMDIAAYEESSHNNHDPKRERKLLLHKKQLSRLKEGLEQKGTTIVPLKLYPNEKGIFKIEIGIAKGRKMQDKREYIRDRDSKRELKDFKQDN